METDIRIADVVDSTNTSVLELAHNGAGEGTCVISFCQRKGQGRSGRRFYSPPGGNLYMSLLLRPGSVEEAAYITVYAAVSTVEAIKACFGIDTGIKWVNDIYLRGRKVCGIVAKADDPGGYRCVVLGIGVNIYDQPDVPEEIKDIYGSLKGCLCYLPDKEWKEDAVTLGKCIMERFAYYYDGARKEEAIDKYREYSVILGKTVQYMSGNLVMSAKAVSIDDEGGLVLDDGTGTRSYRDGEIRIVPDNM